MSDTTTSPVDDTDTLLDQDWLAAPSRRSRTTAALAVALVVSASFLGGALAHQHWGATDTTSASGFPGAGPGAGFPSDFPGAPAEAQPGDQTSAATTGPASVIGTVVSISQDTWVIEDLGGTKHTITVPDTTRVIREQQASTAAVAEGDVVTVTGEGPDRESLTASRITLR